MSLTVLTVRLYNYQYSDDIMLQLEVVNETLY